MNKLIIKINFLQNFILFLPVMLAIRILTLYIQNDKGYAWGWQSNIAMASYDEGLDHESANKAAARFMRMLFGVDMTTSTIWHKTFPFFKGK